jgi:flagellum-specific ATP synthase
MMKLAEHLPTVDPIAVYGRVAQAVGLVIEGYGPISSIGEVCEIRSGDEAGIVAEVVGFRGERVLMMPLGDVRGIGPGSRLIPQGTPASVPIGEGLLGRVIDGLGRPLDGRGPLGHGRAYSLYAEPMNPLHRGRISEPLDLGIRAINSLLTCGRGQKVGVFAGSGVGKSVLLGMMSRYTEADINVIALIGERGREVKEFLEKDLTAEGLRRSVVVVATSDQPPLVRIRGAFLATAIGEFFRDAGQRVLLLMDSLTRLAQAQREVGLAIGEPPTTKGYPPSVFAMLPRILERVGGCTDGGSLTGLYTVLVEGDDLADPIADAARSILDGHIVLSRELAAQGHYPAIDVLNSVSRVMPDIVSTQHQSYARHVVELLSAYRRAEDLINLGAYKAGTSSRIDLAIRMHDPIREFLRQDINEQVSFSESVDALSRIVHGRAEGLGVPL